MKKAILTAVLAVLVTGTIALWIIQTERSSGASILGMAIIFALSWLYHRFISKAHD